MSRSPWATRDRLAGCVRWQVLVLASVFATTPALALERSQGEAIFTRYQALERAFDPAVADLYCDTAHIRNVRTYPDGRQRVVEIPAIPYKALVRSAMPWPRRE